MHIGTALAQPAAPQSGEPSYVVTMEPVEIDTIACRFLSWTLTGAGTATVTVIGPPAQTDSTPANLIIAGPTLSSNQISVQLSPDNGCGATGCRNGNSYQVKLKPAAGTDAPTCNFRVDVKKVAFR
ncbi:MAG: hypothetical protein AB7U73_23135 [Pirellulales bacterium]|uniref:hypothetical protein n=1 Tax=Bradyrhizobium sp. TaxID=376 RepID=UPI003D14C108